MIMKTPKPTFTNGFGSFRYGILAQHHKSNKRLHKTFGWILVETADFKNRAIMLQWCLFVEREENYALYNGRGGCHLRFFERALAQAGVEVSVRKRNAAFQRGVIMGTLQPDDYRWAENVLCFLKPCWWQFHEDHRALENVLLKTHLLAQK